jgi:long-chain acyl-CoA synthetase
MVLHIGGPPVEQQRMIGVLPLFHVFALTNVLNFSVDTAAEMILLPKFDLTQLLRVIRRTKPTYLPAVPTIFGAIVQAADKDEIDFSALKFCISGGAPLPLDTRLQFEQLTGCRIVEGYGLSEASPIVTCNPSDGLIKDNSCGIAMAGTSIEIRDLADPHHLLPAGERGEVSVRGPQVMRGYWGRPAETGDVFVDGALRTGDVGYLDEDGYLFLVDRIKDVILCSGYKVYPRLIEDALYEHPDVTEAVVIGVTDPYRGQAPKAFVVLRAGASPSEEDLKAFLTARLSKIEMPRDIEFRASLPRTLIGKLSKKELIAEEAGRSG